MKTLNEPFSKLSMRRRYEVREGLVHRLPYWKTDCTSQFEVANDSLATARMTLRLTEGPVELTTDAGAVLEMSGKYA